MKLSNEIINTPDGFTLKGEIMIPDGEIKKTVLMCHGLTSNKEGRRMQLSKIANTLCNNGYRVIRFDFRGHGQSSGADMDVCPSSYYLDVKTIVDTYLKNEEFYIFGFSFGGFAVNQYLYLSNNNLIKKVVLIGPALDPINSSLLNPKEFCEPEISEAIKSGSLETDGYAFWKSKDWHVSKKFIDECYQYDYKKAMTYLTNKTLLLQGKNDKNVDKDFNERYANEYNIKYKEYDASHSLWEVIDEVAIEILNYFDK